RPATVATHAPQQVLSLAFAVTTHQSPTLGFQDQATVLSSWSSAVTLMPWGCRRTGFPHEQASRTASSNWSSKPTAPLPAQPDASSPAVSVHHHNSLDPGVLAGP